VDLKGFGALPDTFIVPSKDVFAYFKRWGVGPRPRYHPLIEDVAQFKNEKGWKQLEDALKDGL